MKTLMIAAVATIVAAFSAQAGSDATFKIDTEKSKVAWTGEKVTGSHNGLIRISDGTVDVNGDMVKSANLTMDMTTISCLDIEDETYNKKLVGHLKSPDFFDVSQHPEASFKISSINAVSGKEDANYEVKGVLTIKGISQPVTFPAQIDVANGQLTAKADLTFDRTKYDIRYKSGSFFENLGDKVIYDDVKVSFELVANTAK